MERNLNTQLYLFLRSSCVKYATKISFNLLPHFDDILCKKHSDWGKKVMAYIYIDKRTLNHVQFDRPLKPANYNYHLV